MDIKTSASLRNQIVQGLALAALLMAGSCAAPTNDANGLMADGAVNHPIMVEPSYQAIRLYYSPADAGGISPADADRFQGFVSDYLVHGNGAIAVNAPGNRDSQRVIAFFAQRINDMGVPKDHIIVATHDAPDGDMRVEINYVSYQARTEKCGNWSENLAYTADNMVPKNFGCAVQQNIAAQIADPRDLIAPRPMDDASPGRRATVVDNYEQGKITAADKRKGDLTNEQSGTSSSVKN